MKAPPTPPDEAARQQALDETGLHGAGPVPVLDDIVALAAHLCGVPIAFIGLIDRDRQVLLASVGLDVRETSREVSFCGHAIAGTGVMVVPDATLDERFADNPLVTGSPFLRFYAGRPLRVGAGRAIGTLCVADTRPRAADATILEMLERLGRLATLHLEDCRRRNVQAA